MHQKPPPVLLASVVVMLSLLAVSAQNLDEIGVTALRAIAPGVDGTGVRVAQPEGSLGTNWEVNPSAVGFTNGAISYFSANGSTNGFPNSLSGESSHADAVGQNFYGLSGGVATNVAHVDNFDADHFVNSYVFSNLFTLGAVVVNQSFTFGALSVSNQQGVDSAYDDYAVSNGVIFVSAANNIGNGAIVCAPGTDYNCISVGAYYNGTYANSTGPTIDNGRCKPDITAPSQFTSFSTPQVAGAVALLLQAGARGDGGSDTNAATDMRTLKALLLNGAVKPADWTNLNSSPLDLRYGAGMVNVFNAYWQLAGGKYFPGATNLVAQGNGPLPVQPTNLIPAMNSWAFSSIASDGTDDAANHYFFSATNGIVTATLVWNRQLGQTNINDLDLFLFDASSNLVACSTSRVDNVEHIFFPRLAAGPYDLLVLKHGGANVVSDAETYALAWAFVSPQVSVAKAGALAAVSWPAYPAGFRVETATNLAMPNWTTNNLPVPALVSGTNIVQLPATNNARFFRLRQPNF
jgi:hypothetical protein